jgi:hypothetical protein
MIPPGFDDVVARIDALIAAVAARADIPGNHPLVAEWRAEWRALRDELFAEHTRSILRATLR